MMLPLVLGTLVGTSLSQSCPNLDVSGQPAWQQGSNLTINIDPAIGDNSVAVERALDAWFKNNSINAALTVTYTHTDHAQTGPGTLNIYYVPLNNDPATGQIARGVTSNKTFNADGSALTSATIAVNNRVTDPAAIAEVTAHEIGHTFGLKDCDTCAHGTTVMNTGGSNYNDLVGTQGPTFCDDNTVQVTQYPYPGDPFGDGGSDSCTPTPDQPLLESDCPGSPILLAVGPKPSYALVGPEDGVVFDLFANGNPVKTGWTEASSMVGFLFLDRNGNGSVDNGGELFGNRTPMLNGRVALNGFAALAEFDKAENGGNGNGSIDPSDQVWSALRVWIDTNHDGVSQSDELHTLDELAISAISISASPEMRRDRVGNTFRLRSEFVIDGRRRLAYDVWFVTLPR
jgi:hypothetical protein